MLPIYFSCNAVNAILYTLYNWFEHPWHR